MSSPSKPHAHGEPTAHKGTTSNAVEALPSMPHAHEKHRQSCDEGHLVKLQKFLAKVDQNPKRLEKMIAARRKFDGLATPDSATSRDTSNQAPTSFVTWCSRDWCHSIDGLSMGHLNRDVKWEDECSLDQPKIATQHVCRNWHRMSEKALCSMQRAARLKETEHMFRQIDDLEEFRLWIERDPEAFKKSIKTLREQLDGDLDSQPDTSSDMSRFHDDQLVLAKREAKDARQRIAQLEVACAGEVSSRVVGCRRLSGTAVTTPPRVQHTFPRGAGRVTTQTAAVATAVPATQEDKAYERLCVDYQHLLFLLERAAVCSASSLATSTPNTADKGAAAFLRRLGDMALAERSSRPSLGAPTPNGSTLSKAASVRGS
ncbi:unnamed protein product [Symbiodinium sp. CCMP2592]|nr:unnamed protein product [Symbiodinium sp. CCMP2592]